MFLVRLPMFLGIGMRRFTQGGYERACKDFSESDLSVDMKGKHVMITGANQGLGYATARQLAKKVVPSSWSVETPRKGVLQSRK